MTDSNHIFHSRADKSDNKNAVVNKDLTNGILSPSIQLTDYSDTEESSVPLLKNKNYDSLYITPANSHESDVSQNLESIKNKKDVSESSKLKFFNSSLKSLRENVHCITNLNFFSSTLCIASVLLVITTSAQPLLIFLLKQHGGAMTGTYLFLYPTYLGMIFAGFCPTKKSIWEENWRYSALISSIDIIHQFIEKAGLLYCGPCLYTVASSTNTLFLALFTSYFLSTKITRRTIVSLIIISVAVAYGASGKLCEINATHFIGFLMIIFASMLNALNFVIGEVVLTQNKIEGPNLVCIMGILSLIALSLWTWFWTIPNWKIITLGVKINVKPILIIFFFIFIINIIRSSVYWIVIKEAGSVFTGILKCLRIIIVVFLSDLLFSGADNTQKVTFRKIFTALLCSTGIVLYSLDNKKRKNSKEEEKCEIKDESETNFTKNEVENSV